MRRVVFMLLLLISCSLHADEFAKMPRFTSAVVDETHSLNEQEALALRKKIGQISQDGRVQIAVLIVSTTKPETIEQYSMRVAEKWKPGEKDKDNGVLITIARGDGRTRIEVGRGLEGTLPDLATKEIIEKTLIKPLGQGRVYDALSGAIAKIEEIVNEAEASKETGDIASGLHSTKPAAKHASDDLSMSDIPFFSQLTSGGQAVTVICGVIGGLLILAGLFGDAWALVFIGLGAAPAGSLVLGLVVDTSQCLMMAVAAFVLALAVGFGLRIGGSVLSGGSFAGGGASD